MKMISVGVSRWLDRAADNVAALATIYALVRGHDEPPWLELLWVITFGLYIVIDRLARWAEEQTDN